MARTYGVHDDGYRTLTFDADDTWEIPEGLEELEFVQCWGAGGDGGSGGVVGGGGGGGGGGYRERNTSYAVTPGDTIDIVVGQSAGEESSFDGALVVATGGEDGVNGDAIGSGAGGAGGSGSGGTGGYTGGTGGSGLLGGGGGGAAGDSEDGGDGSGATGGDGGAEGGGDGAGGGANDGDVPGGGGGGGIPLFGGGEGGRGQVTVGFVEVQVEHTDAVFTEDESLAETDDLTSGNAFQTEEAIADDVTVATVAAPATAEAIAETDDLSTLAAYETDEALAETTDLPTVVSLSEDEALAETDDLGTGAVLVEDEAIAETDDLSSGSQLAADEALAETDDLTASGLNQQNWARISPGLGGVSYNLAGTATVGSAEVMVFRDDLKTLVAEAISGPSGAWASELDPGQTYWISYFKAGSPDRGWRTNRDIATVETVVEVGNDGYTGDPGDDSYTVGEGDEPLEDTNGYLRPFTPDIGAAPESEIVYPGIAIIKGKVKVSIGGGLYV